MFKLIGALLGFYFLGFFGAFIGYFLGSFIDRYIAYGIGGVNPLSQHQRQSVFLETVFILMGKLAKADGHIYKMKLIMLNSSFKNWECQLSVGNKQLLFLNKEPMQILILSRV